MPKAEANAHDHEYALSWREINRVLFVGAAAGAIWFLGGAPNPYITSIGMICTIVGGFPIFHGAYENIAQRRMTMELSMTIAIVAALAIREIFTALVITLFVLVAPLLPPRNSDSDDDERLANFSAYSWTRISSGLNIARSPAGRPF